MRLLFKDLNGLGICTGLLLSKIVTQVRHWININFNFLSFKNRFYSLFSYLFIRIQLSAMSMSIWFVFFLLDSLAVNHFCEFFLILNIKMYFERWLLLRWFNSVSSYIERMKPERILFFSLLLFRYPRT